MAQERPVLAGGVMFFITDFDRPSDGFIQTSQVSIANAISDMEKGLEQ